VSRFHPCTSKLGNSQPLKLEKSDAFVPAIAEAGSIIVGLSGLAAYGALDSVPDRLIEEVDIDYFDLASAPRASREQERVF